MKAWLLERSQRGGVWQGLPGHESLTGEGTSRPSQGAGGGGIMEGGLARVVGHNIIMLCCAPPSSSSSIRMLGPGLPRRKKLLGRVACLHTTFCGDGTTRACACRGGVQRGCQLCVCMLN